MSTYQFDLPRIIEYLRVMVRRGNKQELATNTGIPYTRLIYFARSANSTPNPGDITALVKHFMPGYTFAVPTVDVIPPRPVVEAPPVTPVMDEVAA